VLSEIFISSCLAAINMPPEIAAYKVFTAPWPNYSCYPLIKIYQDLSGRLVYDN